MTELHPQARALAARICYAVNVRLLGAREGTDRHRAYQAIQRDVDKVIVAYVAELQLPPLVDRHCDLCSAAFQSEVGDPTPSICPVCLAEQERAAARAREAAAAVCSQCNGYGSACVCEDR